jgi:uncharacterized protein YndB with AHSA1/START domain
MAQTNFTVKREELSVVMDRVFDAPRDLVWKTISDPALIPQWWGPRQFTTVVDKMDFRVGGEWRFVHKNDQGEYGFHGVYKEITKPSLVSDTFNFEGVPTGHEMVETMVLEDLGNGKTKVTTTSVYANIEDLDGMVGSGMEGGAKETWERLAELVEKR